MVVRGVVPSVVPRAFREHVPEGLQPGKSYRVRVESALVLRREPAPDARRAEPRGSLRDAHRLERVQSVHVQRRDARQKEQARARGEQRRQNTSQATLARGDGDRGDDGGRRRKRRDRGRGAFRRRVSDVSVDVSDVSVSAVADDDSPVLARRQLVHHAPEREELPRDVAPIRATYRRG